MTHFLIAFETVLPLFLIILAGMAFPRFNAKPEVWIIGNYAGCAGDCTGDIAFYAYYSALDGGVGVKTNLRVHPNAMPCMDQCILNEYSCLNQQLSAKSKSLPDNHKL